MQFDCYRQYLNSTNQSIVVQYVVTCTLPIQIILCFFLTHYYDFGVSGVAFANLVTLSLNLLLISLYCWTKTEHKLYPLPIKLSSLLKKQDLKVYMGISSPSIVMLCAEWWAYDILTIMATVISVPAVGSMAISYNFYGLMFYFP